MNATDEPTREQWVEWFRGCATDGDLTAGERAGFRLAALHMECEDISFRDGKIVALS